MKLAKTYDAGQYEPNIYALWESSGAFAPKGEGEPFSVVMPPPNANGNLHIGHALTYCLQDIIARYQRMKGRDVAYIPGMDHAGFETWVVYEKELARQGKSRFDFTREQLYAQVWNFVDEQRGNVELQMRALGIGASWNDLVFTLDKKVIDIVYGTFKRLWDEGLVYRGERIVNYCTVHQTSFADIEVEHKEEKSKLWNIAFPLVEARGELVIATTRPETKLGQSALMVHPDDERYKQYVGMHVFQPLVPGVEIPVVADEHVDPAYGTGVVTVTPAHDSADFEVAKKHNLPLIQLIGIDGRLTENVPPSFRGLTVMEARQKIIPALQAVDALRGEKDIVHSVGHCYKCGSVIEPLAKEQWFLRVRPLAERAKQALEQDLISFTPASKKQVLIQYIDGLKDWNLSRQIPWGIPIPAFQNMGDPNDWIFDTRVEDKFIDVNGTTYRREEDTFDTWFSSGQWPFVVTDHLADGPLAHFYPTSVMATGADLLDRWIGRMIMLGVYTAGDVPFRHVYLNGMVFDEKGQKMSKSKGNVINPMEIVSQYGSDAMRLGIITSRSAGQNQAFSTPKVIAARNFCNKLWNIARYTEDKLGQGYRPSPPTPKTIADHWIIRELNQAGAEIGQLTEDYRFAEAAERVYHTIWSQVADWYIEASKTDDNPAMLGWVLETALRLAHPFTPFVTETIWQTLGWKTNLLITESWPQPADFSDIAAEEFERIKDLVSEARFAVNELPGSKRYQLLYSTDSLIADNAELIAHLARLSGVVHTDQPRGLRLAALNREAWLDIDEKTLHNHQTNLEHRLAETLGHIDTLRARLDNIRYVEQAPARLVEESREQLAAAETLTKRLRTELDILA